MLFPLSQPSVFALLLPFYQLPDVTFLCLVQGEERWERGAGIFWSLGLVGVSLGVCLGSWHAAFLGPSVHFLDSGG